MTRFGSDGHLRVGAWLGNWPSADDVDAFQERIGCRLDIVHLYADWATDPAAIVDALGPIRQAGATPMLTWEPRRDGRDASTTEIAGGDHDETIQAVARALAEEDGRVLLRPMHEMNGNWYGWALGDHPENTQTSFQAAWHRIRDTMREAGARRVEYVWSPNHASVGDGATLAGTYPGDPYVDLVGVDGFNWLPEEPRSFDVLFGPALSALAASTGRPILMTEIACAENRRDGRAKPAWIHDALRTIVRRRYERVLGFVWFHEDKHERGDIRRWRIDSSTQSLDAFRAALLWVHSPVGMASRR